MEKYSVLMSVYKKENPDYLAEALKSMINQTVRPDEIVLVEDGPLTDDLYTVIDNYCKEFPGLLNIVVNEWNLGLGLALKKGLESCKNELVARMDTDDISELDRCEKQLSYFQNHPSVSVVGGIISEFDSATQKITGQRILPKSDKEIKMYMIRRCPFNHVSVMFKKSDILSVGNYRSFLYNEDYDLWIRMASNNYQFANLDEQLVKVRVGIDFIARRGGKEYFKSEYLLQKELLAFGITNRIQFVENIVLRVMVQLMLTNSMRSFFYRYFLRST